jgi:predicted RNA-binding protein with PUA-like domain
MVSGLEAAMAHWLFKSEPSAWSFQRLTECGAKGTDWSGVRNHSAKLNMQAMKVGELGFFYHSNEGKAIVGLVEVVKAYRPDPTDASGKFGMVDIRALHPLPRPVTLEAVKAEKRLHSMALVTNSRLSVQPVTAEEWTVVCEMGGLEASHGRPKRA